MAFLTVNNVKIKGISACVPAETVKTQDYQLLSEEEIQKYIVSTGIEERRRAKENQCTSDLCCVAAEKLISELGWDKQDIDLLVVHLYVVYNSIIYNFKKA